MFTTFLILTAVAVTAWMATLLARRNGEVEPVRVPLAPVGVTVAAVALVALGLWLV